MPLLSKIRDAVLAPDRGQREAYGNFCHMLSIAAVVGCGFLVATTDDWGVPLAVQTAGLLVLAVVLFVVGAVLSNGE